MLIKDVIRESLDSDSYLVLDEARKVFRLLVNEIHTLDNILSRPSKNLQKILQLDSSIRKNSEYFCEIAEAFIQWCTATNQTNDPSYKRAMEKLENMSEFLIAETKQIPKISVKTERE